MSSNGRLPLSSLVKVDGWAYLAPNTGSAWVLFCNEMQSLGYARPTITAPDGAYRDIAGQTYWKKYWTDRGLPGNAATPGYSNHGLGTSVDIYNVYQYPRAVIVRVAAKYGFTFNVPSEQWHMQHNGTAPAGGNVTPIEENELDATEREWLNAAATDAANIRYMLETFIKPQTDKIDAMAVAVGVIQWACVDNNAGLRRMVANLTELVGKIEQGDLSQDEVRSAVSEALAPLTVSSAEEVAVATADEIDRRARQRLEDN